MIHSQNSIIQILVNMLLAHSKGMQYTLQECIRKNERDVQYD